MVVTNNTDSSMSKIEMNGAVEHRIGVALKNSTKLIKSKCAILNIERISGSNVSTDEIMTENNCFVIKHDKALDSNANASTARSLVMIIQTKYCPIEGENSIE